MAFPVACPGMPRERRRRVAAALRRVVADAEAPAGLAVSPSREEGFV